MPMKMRISNNNKDNKKLCHVQQWSNPQQLGEVWTQYQFLLHLSKRTNNL